jgi:hypothetical protein
MADGCECNKCRRKCRTTKITEKKEVKRELVITPIVETVKKNSWSFIFKTVEDIKYEAGESISLGSGMGNDININENGDQFNVPLSSFYHFRVVVPGSDNITLEINKENAGLGKEKENFSNLNFRPLNRVAITLLEFKENDLISIKMVKSGVVPEGTTIEIFCHQ